MTTPSNSANITVRTPGKLILSGEHAVVYGNPALAMAVNRYTETTISRRAARKNILFNLANLSYHQDHSLLSLRRLKASIQSRYDKFLQGKYGIRDVLREPFELLQYAVSHVIDHRELNPQGVEIHTDSNIPIGCGMGSSAAAVVSVMYGVARFSNSDVDLHNYHQLAWDAENMQHGHSSGVDVFLVLHGGCIRFLKDGQKEIRPLPQRPFLLVNTGTPSATTGESVHAAANHLKHDSGLLAEFSQVTANMDLALQTNNNQLLQDSVHHNQQLLTRINVVPEKVQRFIRDVEKTGATAKICGAGAAHGDAAGVVLVVADHDMTDLVQHYNYQAMQIEGEPQGTHIV